MWALLSRARKQAVLLCLLSFTVAASDRIILPIEVVGGDGVSAAVTFDVPAGQGSHIRSLWMQIHNLAYADMASVQLNDGAWISLNNQSASVDDAAKSYGGIGGGFSTIKLSVAVSPRSVHDGSNIIRFRLNQSDGLASGFRVLAFNLMGDDERHILPDSDFAQDDPRQWRAPRPGAADIAAGKSAWSAAQLVANNRPGAAPIRAHCSDCHAQDGRDLKYFNFSNASIIARSQFHGLTREQGEQIASYIRALDGPSPGRPWNPPYQPGPGLDKEPVSNWAAGAGLASVADRDEDALKFVFPNGITPDAFRPDGELNAREIPIAMQMPDWNHWLPRVHPLDAWGEEFAHSETAANQAALRAQLTSKVAGTNDLSNAFDRWNKAQRKFLARSAPREAEWTADLGNKIYSTQLWGLVKSWELAQEFQLEGQRNWPNTIPLATAPAEAGIPDGPSGMGNTAVTNEYFSNAWYQLQIVLNDGGHRRHGRQPIDWLYVIDHFRTLEGESHRPEPSRLLVAVIKAMQSSDPKIGPENELRGWRPEATVDPRIMVSREWTPEFQSLRADVRRSITEAMLSAWLDKTLKYRTAQYFAQGKTARESYTAPKEFAEISGGNTWAAARQFQAGGVSEATLARLLQWGKAWTNMAARLQY